MNWNVFDLRNLYGSIDEGNTIYPSGVGTPCTMNFKMCKEKSYNNLWI